DRKPAMTLTDEDPTPPETVLVTGFPSFTAARMVKKVLAADAGARVTMLTREKFAEAAKALAAGLADAERDRLRILVGDVSDMDLGLAGGEVKQLAAEVTTIHHLAGVYYLGVPREQAERVNVHGTQNVLELAGECRRLRRLCHWSTAAVAGKRRGVILEEELDEGQGFRNFYEETKHEAERLARAAARRPPVTLFRPGLLGGDPRTRAIPRLHP